MALAKSLQPCTAQHTEAATVRPLQTISFQKSIHERITWHAATQHTSPRSICRWCWLWTHQLFRCRPGKSHRRYCWTASWWHV